jgi:hypothetical protein
MKPLKYKCYVTGYIKRDYVNLEWLRLRPVVIFFSFYKPVTPRTVVKLWDTLYKRIVHYKNTAEKHS